MIISIISNLDSDQTNCRDCCVAINQRKYQKQPFTRGDRLLKRGCWCSGPSSRSEFQWTAASFTHVRRLFWTKKRSKRHWTISSPWRPRRRSDLAEKARFNATNPHNVNMSNAYLTVTEVGPKTDGDSSVNIPEFRQLFRLSLDCHPSDCEMNQPISHCQNVKAVRARGIEMVPEYAATYHAYNKRRFFPAILGLVSLPCLQWFQDATLSKRNLPTSRGYRKSGECEDNHAGHRFNSFMSWMCSRLLWPLGSSIIKR
jgi:hypothetical protein